MPIWVNEFGGWVNDVGSALPAGQTPPIRTTMLSSGSSSAASTLSFATGCKMFTIAGDVAAYISIGSSTAGVQSSSLSMRIPANAPPEMFGRQRFAGNTTLYAYST